MVYTQARIYPKNETHNLVWDFDKQTDHLNSARRPDLIIVNWKEFYRIVDIAIPADHKVKLKECEKKEKYLDHVREFKKLWNMIVTIIPYVIGGLGTVSKGLVQGVGDLEITGRVETVQTTALLRPTRILRRALETWGDLLSFKPLWKTISYCSCEKLSIIIIIIIISEKKNSSRGVCGGNGPGREKETKWNGW